jgi:hypothetical protein
VVVVALMVAAAARIRRRGPGAEPPG